MADENRLEASMRAVQADFARLWTSITRDGDRPRPLADQQLLLDQIRMALDRGSWRIEPAPAGFVAGTFAIEAIVYRSETTEILQLRHRDLGTLHALKTVPQAVAHATPLTERLRREADIGLSLRHPNLVETAILLRLDDGRPGILEAWHDRSLATAMDELPQPPIDIRAVTEQLLHGLAAVHAAGYVHCDISLTNIFLATTDVVKLGDFGISLKIGERHSDLGLRTAAARPLRHPNRTRVRPPLQLGTSTRSASSSKACSHIQALRPSRD